MRTLTSLITALVLSCSTVAAVGCASSGAEDESSVDGEATSAGKLSLWQAGDGWHFNVKSGNGAILLTSEAYTARTGAIAGALSVLNNGVDPAQYEVNATATGWNLHLKAANHETIASSQVYASKSNATRAIASSVKAVTSYLDKKEAITTGARIDILVGASGQFRFNVFAKNGQIVLSSEHYTTEAAAVNGAFAVQAAATSATNFSVLENRSKSGFYFTLTATNGEIVGISQQYTTRQSAQSAVTSVQALLPTISIL